MLIFIMIATLSLYKALLTAEGMSHDKDVYPLSMSARGQDSIVVVVTHYGLEGLGFETPWGQEIFFSPCPSRSALRDSPSLL